MLKVNLIEPTNSGKSFINSQLGITNRLVKFAFEQYIEFYEYF